MCFSLRVNKSVVDYAAPLVCAGAVCTAGLLASGCSSGGGNSGGGTSAQAPNIVNQPVNQSVPMGLTATFSAGVSGYPLNYQWLKDGVPIPGATSSSTYTTPDAAFAYSGTEYTLTVSNSLGTTTSNAAMLTVIARAPQPGDLRFQQVNAPSTVNGYTGEEGTNLVGWGQLWFGDATGTPLSVGPGCPATGSGLEQYGYQWDLNASYLPTNMTSLTTYYQGSPFEEFATELNTLSASNAVVTGLDIEPLSDTFAASWVQTSAPKAGGSDPWSLPNETFDMAQNTVTPADFQAAASQDGANSRVLTAVSWNSSQIFYLSYGWARDSTTAYEAKVATATVGTLSSVTQQLAADGYIVTAIGGTATDGILLVGTRVQGDTAPRPIMVVHATQGGELSSLT